MSSLDALLEFYKSGQAGVAELHLMRAIHTFFPSAGVFAITVLRRSLVAAPRKGSCSPDQQRGVSAGPRGVHGKNREQPCAREGGEKRGKAIPALHSYTQI